MRMKSCFVLMVVLLASPMQVHAQSAAPAAADQRTVVFPPFASIATWRTSFPSFPA